MLCPRTKLHEINKQFNELKGTQLGEGGKKKKTQNAPKFKVHD